MKKYTLLFCISLLMADTSRAKTDVEFNTLLELDSKLDELTLKLNEPRIKIGPKNFLWPELEDLKETVFFVAAHDPTGSISKDTPEVLHPAYLTRRLETSFSKLELSATQISSLTSSYEWKKLKDEISLLINNRHDHLYGPARSSLRSGVLTNSLLKLENVAAKLIVSTRKYEDGLKITVLDPNLEKIGVELSGLSASIRTLKENSAPKSKVKESIFKLEHIGELTIFSLLLFLGWNVSKYIIAMIEKKKQKTTELPSKNDSSQTFDYHAWLDQLEGNLKALKKNEERCTETYIQLKNLSVDFSNSRKALNLAETQKDFYSNLDLLNSTAPRIEEYFDKFEIKKNLEFTNRNVKLILQLCAAIERKQSIQTQRQNSKAKAIPPYPKLKNLEVA